jgi:hypothetical protein
MLGASVKSGSFDQGLQFQNEAHNEEAWGSCGAHRGWAHGGRQKIFDAVTPALSVPEGKTQPRLKDSRRGHRQMIRMVASFERWSRPPRSRQAVGVPPVGKRDPRSTT